MGPILTDGSHAPTVASLWVDPKAMILILADIGVPMIFLQWPAMLCALVPVIIIEGLLARRLLRISDSRAFQTVGLANIFSAIAGVPLAWLVMWGIMLATRGEGLYGKGNSPAKAAFGFLLKIAWLDPDERNLYWMIPLAMMLLLIPSFFVSVWLEYLVCSRGWSVSGRSAVRKVVFEMNAASYAFLFLIGCAWLLYAICTNPR